MIETLCIYWLKKALPLKRNACFCLHYKLVKVNGFKDYPHCRFHDTKQFYQIFFVSLCRFKQ